LRIFVAIVLQSSEREGVGAFGSQIDREIRINLSFGEYQRSGTLNRWIANICNQNINNVLSQDRIRRGEKSGAKETKMNSAGCSL